MLCNCAISFDFLYLKYGICNIDLLDDGVY